MEDFIIEVQKMPTHDIILILEDQIDLYTEEEIRILRKELDSRPKNALELEDEEFNRRSMEQDIARQEEEKRRQIEAANKAIRTKLDRLKSSGYEGYWEYKVVTLNDDNAGGINIYKVEQILNEFGREGWHLINSYSNELGKNASSVGLGGLSLGTNSSIDQHIFIFERFIRL